MDAKKKVLVRSGGDLASAVIQKLHRTGFQVVVSELKKPKMVRRTVSYSNAVYEGFYEVEGIVAKHVEDLKEINSCHKKGIVPIVTLPENQIIEAFKPNIFVDATLSKQPVSYHKGKFPFMVGLGPDIEASVNVDIVIETCRGHDLGRLIFEGFAIANTSIPGFIDGYAKERVLRAPCDGEISCEKSIGEHVEIDEVILNVSGEPVKAQISGVIRGLIHPDVIVHKGLKVGDVDPRASSDYCYSISDKGRNIAGGVLEAIMIFLSGGIS